ncbi:DgyrCDS6931 [Dimorphilus gyrociliatus]|uniref:Methylosome subunit pICln n=1 Tax=Dimorphilus gyrociliatus TaxID=2664684 RepID=A0A7I8VQ44_9ANNE|nr:DgyrCDS6931 [Dimorphilus gyrociliatus]
MILEAVDKPLEGIVHEERDVTVYFQRGGSVGKGTLYIAENELTWQTDDNKGFSLQWPDVSLHAILTEVTADFPHQCVMVVATVDLDEKEEAGDDSASEKSVDAEVVTTFQLVPDSVQKLEPIYKAMCECVALHPCSDGEEDDEEDNEGNDNDENWEADPNGTADETEKAETMDDLPTGDSGPNGSAEPMEQGQFDDAE